jgi:dihydrofolate reductase
VHNLTVSLDGYVAGPEQSLEHPLGVGGMRLHDWMFAEPVAKVDQRFVDRRTEGVGATIMGRNMFGPVRGGWGGSQWSGWWGDDPPFHHDVFVLTHHAHAPIPMAGGTTFHFATGGIEASLDQAMAAADGQDVVLGGGASAVRQFMAAGLVDELHVAIAPILLGDGERLFEHGHAIPDDYVAAEVTSSPAVAHVVLSRR